MNVSPSNFAVEQAEAQAQIARAALADLQAQYRQDGDPTLAVKIAEAESDADTKARIAERARALLSDPEAVAARAELEAKYDAALAQLHPDRVSELLEPLIERELAANRERFEVRVACAEVNAELTAKHWEATRLATALGVRPPSENSLPEVEARVRRIAKERLLAEIKPLPNRDDARRMNAVMDAVR